MEEERRKGVKERKEGEMAGSSDGRSEWCRARRRVRSKKGSREEERRERRERKGREEENELKEKERSEWRVRK